MIAGNALAQTRQELQSCRAISDSLQRLSCFDRVVALPNSVTPGTDSQEIGVVDLITDGPQLRGKTVRVRGFAISAGETMFLYSAAGQMTAVMVNMSKVDREGRRLALTSCGGGCEIVVAGQATYQFNVTGLAATSIQIK